MSEKLFYDDCFITKYKRLRGLVPELSCDSIMTTKSNNKHVVNNVDYFSFKLTESQLYECWKIIHRKTSMKDVRALNKLKTDENLHNKVEDLMLLIPSTSSTRLENSAWRAWAKATFHLGELNPAELNWFKENDITWLYGPLIMSEEEQREQESQRQKQQQHEISKKLTRNPSTESLSSLSSTETISSVETASTSVTSDDLTNFHSKPLTKSILKEPCSTLTTLKMLSVEDTSASGSDKIDSTAKCQLHQKRRSKRVSFNSIMEKREIIDDEIYDYNLQFIDNERVGFGYYNL